MRPTRLRQLEAFHALLQTGSVTRTAELLSISQPAVSKLLRSLEAETGLPLFNRLRRRLVPTPEAHRLWVEVERLFLSARRVDEVARDIRGFGTGELRVAALPILGLRFLPGVLAKMRARHRRLRLSLAVESSQQVAGTVLAHGADIGFVLPLADERRLARGGTIWLPAVAVLPRTHRYARHRVLTPAEFAGDVFISLGRGYRMRHLVDGLFDDHGVPRRLEIETQNAAAACELAASGAGVTVVDLVTATSIRDRAAVIPITPTVSFQIDIVLPLTGSVSGLVREMMQRVRRDLDGAEVVLNPGAAVAV